MATVLQRSGLGQISVIPAPLGGLNTRDPLDAMHPADAIKMLNWYVAPDGVRIRRGRVSFRTGIGSGNVETLAEYYAGSTRKLIACGGGAIYDATQQAPTSLATGLTEDRWQTAMFQDASAGPYLAMVNGADTPRKYNGSISTLTITGSGLTSSTLVGVFTFKGRSYFWQNNSQDFWYSATGVLGDALTKFPLGRVSTFGGNLMAMSSISTDTGSGPDDFAVFVMTSGDVLVYSGSDPGGSDWAIVGRFKTAVPVNVRSVKQWGGDCYILTRRGLVSVKKLMGAPSDLETTLSDKIRPTLIDAVTAALDLDGIELQPFSTDDFLVVNTPRDSVTFDQYVMSLSSGMWGGPFQGFPARTWGVYDGRLFFGGTNGTIWEYTGTSDAGTSITADCETAFNVVGTRGQVKSVAALRPTVTASGTVTAAIAAQFDYKRTSTGTPQTILAESDTWEEIADAWEDWSTVWGNGNDTTAGKWFLARGHGYAMGVRFQIVADGTVRWESTGIQGTQGKGWK